MAPELKRIYNADTAEVAAKRLEEFGNILGGKTRQHNSARGYSSRNRCPACARKPKLRNSGHRQNKEAAQASRGRSGKLDIELEEYSISVEHVVAERYR